MVQKKCRETLFKNYGVSSPLKSKEIYERVKKTNFERYGTEFIGSAMSDAISEGHRKHWSNVIGEDAYSRLRDRDLIEYQYRTFGVVWMVGEYGVSDVLIYRRLHELGINTYSNTTKIEKDVAAMLEDAGFEFLRMTELFLMVWKLTYTSQNTKLELNVMVNIGTQATLIIRMQRRWDIISKSFFWPNQKEYVFSSSGVLKS